MSQRELDENIENYCNLLNKVSKVDPDAAKFLESILNPEECTGVLGAEFIWGNTTQGWDYWADIDNAIDLDRLLMEDT